VGLVKIHESTNLAEMAVLKSELDAAGIYNFIQTYHHGTINALALIALGGQRMLIEESDVDFAKDFIKAREGIQDYDALPVRKFGQWKRATVFGLAFGMFLPIYFLRSIWLLALSLILILFCLLLLPPSYNDLARTFLVMASGFGMFGLLLCHAEYVALPRIRKQNHVSLRHL